MNNMKKQDKLYIGQEVHHTINYQELGVPAELKIGITHTLKTRKKGLSGTLSPTSFEFLIAWLVPDAFDVEQLLHRVFIDRQTIGEFHDDHDGTIIENVRELMKRFGYEEIDLGISENKNLNTLRKISTSTVTIKGPHNFVDNISRRNYINFVSLLLENPENATFFENHKYIINSNKPIPFGKPGHWEKSIDKNHLIFKNLSNNGTKRKLEDIINSLNLSDIYKINYDKL